MCGRPAHRPFVVSVPARLRLEFTQCQVHRVVHLGGLQGSHVQDGELRIALCELGVCLVHPLQVGPLFRRGCSLVVVGCSAQRLVDGQAQPQRVPGSLAGQCCQGLHPADGEVDVDAVVTEQAD